MLLGSFWNGCMMLEYGMAWGFHAVLLFVIIHCRLVRLHAGARLACCSHSCDILQVQLQCRGMLLLRQEVIQLLLERRGF